MSMFILSKNVPISQWVGLCNITSPEPQSCSEIVDPYRCLSKLLYYRIPRRRRTMERQEGHVTSRRERTRPSGILIFLPVCYTRVSACLCAGQCNTSPRDIVVGREEKSVAIKRHALPRPRDIGPCTHVAKLISLTYRAHIHPCLRSIFVFSLRKIISPLLEQRLIERSIIRRSIWVVINLSSRTLSIY